MFLMKFWKHAEDHWIGESCKGHLGNLVGIPRRMGKKETSRGRHGKDIRASSHAQWESELEKNASQEEKRSFSGQEEGRNEW